MISYYYYSLLNYLLLDIYIIIFLRFEEIKNFLNNYLLFIFFIIFFLF